MLDSYGIPHENLGRCGRTSISLARELLIRCMKLLRVVRRERPDIMVAIGGTFIAPVGRITRTPTVIFSDTEHATVSNSLAFPLSHYLVVPSCYRKSLTRNHVSYNGYHELAYLHPGYYIPDPSVLALLGVKEGDTYVIMRFVSWESGHDIGHSGLSLEMKRKAVRLFSRYAKVFISAEKALPHDLDAYRIHIPPERMHDALYYATMLYGESATMASECSILGTPALFIDNVGRGYTDEQERVYGSVFNFTESLEDQEKSILKGIEILETDNIKTLWKEKRNRLLNDKIDVTNFVVDFIEKASKG